MDAEAPTRVDRIKAGVFWLIVLLALGYVFPRFVGALLMLFSVLVFVLAVVGLAWPSLMRLPNRLASVWLFAVSVGLFIGGGMLRAPPNGESTASDEPPSAPRGVYMEHLSPADQAVAEQGADPAAAGSLIERMLDAEAKTYCQDQLQEAARSFRDQGGQYRWTTVDLNKRFGSRQSTDPDVVVYFGRALEVMGPDGTWTPAFYQCDWNTATEEIVDVHVR